MQLILLTNLFIVLYCRPRLVNWSPQLNNTSECIEVDEKDFPIQIHCDYFATIDRIFLLLLGELIKLKYIIPPTTSSHHNLEKIHWLNSIVWGVLLTILDFDFIKSTQAMTIQCQGGYNNTLIYNYDHKYMSIITRSQTFHTCKPSKGAGEC